MKQAQILLYWVVLFLLGILSCSDGSLSPKTGKARLKLQISGVQTESRSKPTVDSGQNVLKVPESTSDWSTVHVAVFDLSTFEDQTHMQRDAAWNTYHDALNDWSSGGESQQVSWSDLSRLGVHYPIIVNQALKVEGSAATGIVNAADGINHVVVGLNSGDQVIYGAKTLVTAESGEVTTVELYPTRWAAESAQDPTRLTVSPDQVYLNNSQTQQFTCAAIFEDGSSTELTSGLSWSTEPGTAGSIDAQSGLFVAHDYDIGVETVTAAYGTLSARATVNVISDAPENEMLPVPSGYVTLGDDQLGNAAEIPEHAVYVSGFYIDKYEITTAQWREVFSWALENGYTFQSENATYGQGPGFPVNNVSWYDAVKWCNARSQYEGLPPVYFTSNNQSEIYQTGLIDLENDWVNWAGDGYRLPTEAEWEKAARGGQTGHFYPWNSLNGNYLSHIDGSKANYEASEDPYEGLYLVTPVGYYDGNQTPVGSDMANGYGLYDMAGNISEWCWDYWLGDWYRYGDSILDDTRGPSNITNILRVVRGGSYFESPGSLRCAYRAYSQPEYVIPYRGFRTVRADSDPCSNKAMWQSPEESVFDAVFD